MSNTFKFEGQLYIATGKTFSMGSLVASARASVREENNFVFFWSKSHKFHEKIPMDEVFFKYLKGVKSECFINFLLTGGYIKEHSPSYKLGDKFHRGKSKVIFQLVYDSADEGYLFLLNTNTAKLTLIADNRGSFDKNLMEALECGTFKNYKKIEGLKE